LDVNYTRYADDLTFSSPKANVLGKVEAKVAALCRAIESPRLAINSKKTVRASKKMSRRVTGLVLTNDNKVSLGHSEKRRIRASVHSFAIGRLNQELCLQLRGVLAYVNSVEPDFLKRLSRKYGAETIRQIQNLDSG
jgi:RNA-directed DNA polymerase